MIVIVGGLIPALVNFWDFAFFRFCTYSWFQISQSERQTNWLASFLESVFNLLRVGHNWLSVQLEFSVVIFGRENSG
jgi:hypothetical protein